MATSSRDVELVVRARDEATKAITGVSEALKVLTGAQADVGASAQKTDSLLDKLGSSLDTLQKQAQGLQALGVVATQIDKAGAAVQRMEGTTATAGQAVEALKIKQAELAATEQQLAEKQAAATTALKAEEVALKETEKQVGALDTQIKKATEGFNSLAKKMNSGKAASDEMRQAYRDQLATLMPLVEKQVAAEARLVGQKEKAGALAKELKDLGDQYEKVSKDQKTAAADVERANGAFERASKSLNESRAVLTGMQHAAQQAAAALGGVEVKQEAISQAAKTTAQNIEQVSAALKKQASVTPVAAEAPTLSGAAGKRAELQTQKEALDSAAKAYRDAQLAVAALSKEIKDSINPTANQAAALAVAKQTVIEAKQAFEQQQATMARLRAETRAYVNDEEKARVARIQARDAARSAAQAEQEAASAAAQAGAAEQQQVGILRQLTDAFRNLVGEARAHVGAAKDIDTAQKGHADSANGAMAAFSRLKHEVVALAAAYVGLHAAMRGIHAVIETYQSLEMSQAKIAAAFDGNTRAAAQEMNYLRGEAERLGYSYAMVAEKYGKLALAGAGRNFSVSATREVFTAIIEGSRVAGVSVENLDRVLFDFVKMIDLGKMDARDFNGVLRQIPGAQTAIEKALEINGHQFHQMQRSTDGVALTEKVLRDFAKSLREHFASELPAVMSTFHAEWGRFQTTMEETRNLVGKSGFMEALTTAVVRLNDAMKSEEGQRFFAGVGHALGNLVGVLSNVIDHAGVLLTIFKGYVSLRIGQFFVALVPAIMGFVSSTYAAVTAMTALNIAMAGLPVLLGGIVFVLSNVFGEMAMGISAADRAIDQHANTLEKIQKAYVETGGKIDDTRKKLSDLSVAQLQHSEAQLKQDMDAKREKIQTPVDYFGTDSKGTVARIAAVVEAFKKGKVTFAEFKKEIDDVAQADEKLNRALASNLIEAGRAFDVAKTKIEENAAQQRILTGTATEADKAILGLTGAMEKFGHALPIEHIGQFNKAINDMMKAIPELRKLAEYESAKNKIEEDFNKERIAAGDDKERIKRAEQMRDRALGHIRGTYEIDSALGDRNAAIAGAASEDTRSFLSARAGGSSFHVEGVNASFAERLAAALRAAEAATGERAKINELVRDRETQARYYDNYINGRGGLAAPPGMSRHERGAAADIPRGAILDWLHEHAEEFGLEFLKGRAFAADPVHIQLKRGLEGTPAAAENFVDSILRAAGARTPGRGDAIDYAKWGTEVKADDRMPGDVIAIKTKGGGYKLGIYAGTEDGQVKVNTAPGKQESFADADIAFMRRAPTKGEQAKLELEDINRQRKLDQDLADAKAKAIADAEALGRSPRDLFIQQGKDKFLKQVDDAKAAGNPLAMPDEKLKALEESLGKLFDAKTRESESKKVAEIDKRWAEVFNSTAKRSPADIAKDAAQAAGFHFTGGKPDTPEGAAWLSKETQLAENKQNKQGLDQLSGLLEQLKSAKSLLTSAYKEGDLEGIKEHAAEVKRLTEEIRNGIPDVETYFRKFNDQRAIGTIEKLKKGIHDTNTSLLSAREANQMFASGLTGVFDKLAEGLAGVIQHTQTWKGMWGGVRDAFLQFAADFLKKIAEMIIQAQILKLLNAIGFGNVVSKGVGFLGMMHSGGVVGDANVFRPISPSAFAGAISYHTGGLAGLQPNEVPTILQKGEEVLTRADPRNILNGGKQAAPAPAAGPTNVKIVNAIDAGHMLSEALNTIQGQKVFTNYIRSNARALNSALKG